MVKKVTKKKKNESVKKDTLVREHFSRQAEFRQG
jgi:hypothetical protein